MGFGTKQRLLNAQVSFLKQNLLVKKKRPVKSALPYKVSHYRKSDIGFWRTLIPSSPSSSQPTEASEEIKDCMDSVRKGLTYDQAVFTVYVTSCAVNLLPPRTMGGLLLILFME